MAASGNFHVRNEHANVQVRINGIMLPDGVSGFGTFLDTALIGNISLITGALPAQYGLRTSGVLDIQTRTDAFNGGTVGVYGGTRQTFTPSFEYGGQVGQTQYFLTGRFFESNIGLENPTPNWAAIHDHTTQERGFAYVSTIIDPYTRFTLLAGASYGAFQFPNTPGLTPNFTAFGISNFNSALLNENQFEQNYLPLRRGSGRSTALTSSYRISRATAACISSRIYSAISSSTASLPTSIARRSPTA